MKTQSARTAVSIASSLILVAALVADATAAGGARRRGWCARRWRGWRLLPFGRRGQRQLLSAKTRLGGGTGARQAGATQRSGQRAQTQQTASRQAGSTERSGQRAETQQTRTQTRGDTRTSGQAERTEREGQRQTASTERTDSRQQGYTERTDARQQGSTERTEARASAAQNINANNNWDNNYHYDDDDEWGYALAGAAVGATVGYVAGAATAPHLRGPDLCDGAPLLADRRGDGRGKLLRVRRFLVQPGIRERKRHVCHRQRASRLLGRWFIRLPARMSSA